ncbi:alpha/beta hydrolase [Robbsia sp. KACC 23696]|uniref:alpha/beta fold hydrolase n=1 Tax=Robbsia sp. KACC 23696 TaxID=3149231 RepID=UPI00325A662F
MGVVACTAILPYTLAHSAPPDNAISAAASPNSPLPHGVVQSFVQAGPARLQVLSQGKGPTVVILPSLGRSVRDYDEVAQIIAAHGFRVLRPEPRGIGQSRGPMDNLTLHDYANDIAAVIRQEHAGDAVVVGHAWGNFAARQFATDYPDLVKGVVLAAASAGKVPPGSKEAPISPEMRKAIDGAGDLSLSSAQRMAYLKEAFFAPGNDPRPWVDGWYQAAHDAESHARDVTPVDSYFAAGQAPILDLQAEDDAVAPRRFSKVLKTMVGDRVTISVIPHAGHALAPEQPKAMADAIAAFAHRLDAV